MGGGLIQLVAYGAQDVYLTGNPQITFFKVVYRRHTNFARECIEQVFDGTAQVGNSVNCTLSRSGDLVNNINLTCLFTGTAGDSIAHVGHALIKTCEVEIGGQRIDKHYSRWLQIYAELSGAYGNIAQEPGGNRNVAPGQYTAITADDGLYVDTGYAKMIGEHSEGRTTNVRRLTVPLRFWFCNNPGLALPLIALQYHEVKIKMTFETGTTLDLNNATAASISDVRLLVDYIYLDTDERRRFAQVSHEYLIEQVQFNGAVSSNAPGTAQQVTVNYNHPVKYIAWAVEKQDAGDSGETPLFFGNMAPWNSNVGAAGANEGSAKLVLNGNDRFEERPMSYFTCVQPYQHFPTEPAGQRIGVYSFANNPIDHQPSGTCNFSRIDSAIWHLTFGTNNQSTSRLDGTNENLWMFAVNYNVLRIMSGMGGLAYSN
jgi:hypothetical protein